MVFEVINMVTADERAKLMKEQMNIDPEKLEHYLNLFEQWISTQKNIKQLGFNRVCWMNFLIWSKLDFEKVKAKFVRYCYSSLTHAEFVSARQLNPQMDLKCLKYAYFVPMPKLTPEGHRVVIFNVFRPEIFNVLEAARYTFISYDYCAHKENFMVGNLTLLDAQHWRPHHYSNLFNSTLFRAIKFGLENYPLNFRKIVIINVNSTLEKGINLCLPILPEKIRKRVLILANDKDLDKHIPKECLPSDYGGDLKSLEEMRDDWAKLMVENRDFLEKIWNVKPTGPFPKEITLNDDSFGMEGSFRKLNID